MMAGMGAGMIWGSLLVVLLLLGFAYIVWVSASKESGGTKTIGQVIAIIIAILAVIILLYGSVYGGMMGKGFCGGVGMMGRSGMIKGGRMGPEKMMRQMEMMPESERHEMMEEMMEKYGK